MTKETRGFHSVPRPAGISSRYFLVVVDGNGLPHLALTIFYHQFQQELTDGTGSISYWSHWTAQADTGSGASASGATTTHPSLA